RDIKRSPSPVLARRECHCQGGTQFQCRAKTEGHSAATHAADSGWGKQGTGDAHALGADLAVGWCGNVRKPLVQFQAAAGWTTWRRRYAGRQLTPKRPLIS